MKQKHPRARILSPPHVDYQIKGIFCFGNLSQTFASLPGSRHSARKSKEEHERKIKFEMMR